MSKEIKKCCKCGKDAEVGAHGMRDGSIYSEFYCFDHYNKRPKERANKEDDSNE